MACVKLSSTFQQVQNISALIHSWALWETPSRQLSRELDLLHVIKYYFDVPHTTGACQQLQPDEFVHVINKPGLGSTVLLYNIIEGDAYCIGHIMHVYLWLNWAGQSCRKRLQVARVAC